MCILKDNSVEFIDYSMIEYIVALRNLEEVETLSIGIELVHSMPRQGVKSVFSFGQRLGELTGMMDTLGLEYSLIPPRNWQKLILPSDITKSSKTSIAEAVLSLYPKCNLYSKRGALKDGRSDSLGIAHYMKIKGVDSE